MTEPIHIISLGAGVQSSTMALLAAHGEITPLPKCAIFADTQDEPASVYTWLDWLEKQLPFPVHRVTAGSLSEHVTTPYFSKKNQKVTAYSIPAFVKNPDGTHGHMTRQCTSDYKVGPIDREITRQMRDSDVKTCIKWIGISLDEIHRMKPSRRSTVTHIWPLIDHRIRRHDCLRWMQAKGYPEPPRSACIYCPYHSDAEWKRLTPEEFQSAVEFEKRFQVAHGNVRGQPFLHRSLVPLDQVDFSTDEDHGQQVMFGNDCSGHCGV